MRKTKTELKTVAIADDVLANEIYEFRGQKVMLDLDFISAIPATAVAINGVPL